MQPCCMAPGHACSLQDLCPQTSSGVQIRGMQAPHVLATATPDWVSSWVRAPEMISRMCLRVLALFTTQPALGCSPVGMRSLCLWQNAPLGGMRQLSMAGAMRLQHAWSPCNNSKNMQQVVNCYDRHPFPQGPRCHHAITPAVTMGVVTAVHTCVAPLCVPPGMSLPTSTEHVLCTQYGNSTGQSVCCCPCFACQLGLRT